MITSTETETERLIQNLAGQAGTGRGAISFEWSFLAAAALSLVVAVTMVFVLIGVRPDLMAALQRSPSQFKMASTLSLACVGYFLARRAARPGGTAVTLIALVPSILLLALGGATDTSGLPLVGNSDVSVPECVGSILVVSVPALWMILAVLRTGAPTHLGFAGAAAGLLSGAIGAAAYTLACTNDGRPFVAIWYTVAILIMTSLGAVIGRRALAW
jgi:hypothetical protein